MWVVLCGRLGVFFPPRLSFSLRAPWGRDAAYRTAIRARSEVVRQVVPVSWRFVCKDGEGE